MPLPQHPQHLARQAPIPFLPLPSLMASSLLCTGQWHGGDEQGTKSMYYVFFAQVLLLDLRGLPLLPSELIIRQIWSYNWARSSLGRENIGITAHSVAHSGREKSSRPPQHCESILKTLVVWLIGNCCLTEGNLVSLCINVVKSTIFSTYFFTECVVIE